MRLLLFACSEAAIVDRRSNCLSIINLFENFNSPSFPLVLPMLTLVTWAERESGDPELHELKASFSLDSKKIGDVPIVLDYQHGPKVRAIVEIGGIVIEKPGALKIQLQDERKRPGAWHIQIQKVGPPQVSDKPSKKAATSTRNSRKKAKKRAA